MSDAVGKRKWDEQEDVKPALDPAAQAGERPRVPVCRGRIEH